MKISTSERGFTWIEFVDSSKESCRLQKSSLTTIRMGRHDSDPMHLNQEQVKELLPYLMRFVETGELTDGKS